MTDVNEEIVKLMQKRIAEITPGPSAVRGQKKGTKEAMTEFLINLDLNEFSNINTTEDYKQLLDDITKKLSNIIPSKSWGSSRKILNLFLFAVSHDILLNEKYSLTKLIPFLELVLDNKNVKKMERELKEKFDWTNITNHTKEKNEAIQNLAQEIAEKKGCERCYLDLYYWRGDA